MPISAEEYRAKASECAELAAKTNDPQSKRVLEQTAGQLLRLPTVLKSTVLRGAALRAAQPAQWGAL